MEKINFEDGQLTKRGCVTIDGKEYPITEPEYDGATPLSAYVLNKLQDNIEEGINNIQALPIGGTKGQVLTKQSETDGDANWEDIEANEVYIGKAEEAPETAKIIVEEEDLKESSTLGKSEVYVGADEPTTGEKVWFRKGKNLFNKDNATESIYLETTGTTGASSVSNTSEYIKIEKGTLILSYDYTELANQGARGYCFYDNNKSFLSGGTYDNANKVNKLIASVDGYLRFSYDKNATNVKLVQEYNQIFVRNSNGVYEEFIKKHEEIYSTEEKIIGTWVDGKTLYGKTFIFTTDSETYAMKVLNTKIQDADTIFIDTAHSFIKGTDSCIYMINSVRPASDTTITAGSHNWFRINSDKRNVGYVVGSLCASASCNLTVEYTKTTD